MPQKVKSAPIASAKGPSTGNQRNPHTHQAILKAALDLLKTTHYPALTIEAIAAAAGVGKATVYRWWPSKGALVAEAITSALTVEDPPETDDLRADLIAAAEISIRNYAHPPGGLLITALAADLSDDPQLHESFINDFVLPRRRVVRQLLQRAIAEGLIPTDTDPELIMDMWAGAVMYRRLMRHMPVANDLATQLVDSVIVRRK